MQIDALEKHWCTKYTVAGALPGTEEMCHGFVDAHGLCSNATEHLVRIVGWEHGEKDHIADLRWNQYTGVWETDDQLAAFEEGKRQYRQIVGDASHTAALNDYERHLGL